MPPDTTTSLTHKCVKSNIFAASCFLIRFLGQHLLTVCVAADGTRGEPNFNFMSIQEMSEGRDFHCEDAAALKEEEGGGGGRREGGG